MYNQAQEIEYTNILPHSLRPICRAYALGHLTATAPRLFGFLRYAVRRKDITVKDKAQLLLHIISTSAQLNRFPTACAIIVGGATALPRLIKTILQWLSNTLETANGRNSTRLHPRVLTRLRYLCSFLSAWLAFNLLNKDKDWSRRRAASLSLAQQPSAASSLTAATIPTIDWSDKDQLSSTDHPNQHHLPTSPPAFAGKTLDFTLFTLTRALDTFTSTVYTRTLSSRYHPLNARPALTKRVTPLIDPLIFSLSTTIIMWSWFYSPERLPKTYTTWISKAANIDPSLIQALRLARRGDFVYGHNTGQGDLLADLCHSLDKPTEYGDPAITIPVPCDLYHSGTGPSCEYHALRRWMRGWTFAMKLYFPLQLLTRARTIIRLLGSVSISTIATTTNLPNLLLSMLKSASVSSSFLATFISLFYYSVCLARTRLGPRLLPWVSPQGWDSGLCVLAGCLTCGWSILLEDASRRREIAQFTAPRALATLLPRMYDMRNQWKEQFIFASSVAVVMGSVVSGDGNHVRGVLGRVLGSIVREY